MCVPARGRGRHKFLFDSFIYICVLYKFPSRARASKYYYLHVVVVYTRARATPALPKKNSSSLPPFCARSYYFYCTIAIIIITSPLSIYLRRVFIFFFLPRARG